MKKHRPKPPGEVVTPPPATTGTDVNMQAIVRFGIGLALTAASVSALLFFFMQILGKRAAARDPESPPVAISGEREPDQGSALRTPEGGVSLQRQPYRDLEELRRHESEIVSKYAWIDEGAGRIRIPVEYAMRLLVQRGLPVRAGTPAAAAVAPPQGFAAAPTMPPPPTPKPRRRPRPRVEPTRAPVRPVEAPPADTARPADTAAPVAPTAASGPAAEDRRPAPLREIGFDQRIGRKLPLEIPLRDESGRSVVLGDFFGRGRPVVLSLVYYECPMLCTLTLSGLVSALGVLKLEPGRDFDLVTVSFDPRDGPKEARARKRAYLERYKRAGAEEGWHFLTGESEALRRLTDEVGFRYAWDSETRQFAHGAGIVVATADGVLSRYLYGIEYAPKDLRLALVESAAGRLGTPVDQFLLACYRYDPAHGRYGAYAVGLLRVAGVVTVLALGGFLAVMLRRERR